MYIVGTFLVIYYTLIMMLISTFNISLMIIY